MRNLACTLLGQSHFQRQKVKEFTVRAAGNKNHSIDTQEIQQNALLPSESGG